MSKADLNSKKITGLIKNKETGIHYDLKHSGFGVRITKNGHASYIIRYRIGYIQKLLTIGNAKAWTYERACKKWRELKVKIDQNIDPLTEKKDQKKNLKLKDFWKNYRDNYQTKKTDHAKKDEASMWKKHIAPFLQNKYLKDITHSDIQRLHNRITENGYSYRANRVLEVLRRLFNIAINEEHIQKNPCKGVKKNAENPRNRYLSNSEKERLLKALQKSKNIKARNIILLLLLTGARKSEVMKATWDMFDLDNCQWIKPSYHVKQRREHRVPLSKPTMELLRGIRKITNSKYLFPQDANPEAPMQDIKKFWAGLLKEADIQNLRIHDLRHSYASFLASSGISLPTIGALLGHTQVSTTQRYAHLMDEPLRDATNKASEIIGFQHQAERKENDNGKN